VNVSSAAKAPVAASELAAVQRHCCDLAPADADLHSPPGQARVERVVVSIDAQIGLLGHPDHEATVDIGQPRRPRAHPLPLSGQPRGWHRPDRAVGAGVGLLGPTVELVLEIELVGEPPTGLEVRAHEPMRPLEQALGLRVTGFKDDPPTPS
jgi:hypothetical protein